MVRLLAGRLGDLAPLERYNLVSDSWAAALSGRAPLADLLALARALVDSAEGDPSVWSVVLGALGLFDRVVPTATARCWPWPCAPCSGPGPADLGWDPRDDDGERTAFPAGGGAAHPGHHRRRPRRQGRGGRRFGEAGTVALHPDTESAVLDIVASDGGPVEFEAFLARYRAPSTPQEEIRYLYALASFSDPALASRTFDLALTEVRTQNAPFLLQALVANRDGRAVGLASGSPRSGTPWWPSSRPTSSPACSTGSGPCAAPPSWPSGSRPSSRPTRLAAGGRTVEQILERLSVNVAFGQRGGCRSGRHPHRDPRPPDRLTHCLRPSDRSTGDRLPHLEWGWVGAPVATGGASHRAFRP